ncbi:MAG: DNA repair protein RecO, partial [bacterium]|nr:DNA repair protein RecO [bacterium]
AVVLRRVDFSETSQVLVLLTRGHGKVRAIAKGVKRSTKKRFAAGIDLLELGDVVLSARRGGQAQLATLTEWKQSTSFWSLRQRLARLYAGQYAAEVVAGLTEDWDPHPIAFDALVGLLERLCELEQPIPELVGFLGRLLDEIGSMPRFDVCIGCGRAVAGGRDIYFSSFEGGLLCRGCEGAHVEKRRVSEVARALLRSVADPNGLDSPAPAGEVDAVRVADPALGAEIDPAWAGAFDLFNYHVSHLMGRAPLLANKVRPSRRLRRGRTGPNK